MKDNIKRTALQVILISIALFFSAWCDGVASYIFLLFCWGSAAILMGLGLEIMIHG
jgi:hypothetical protein